MATQNKPVLGYRHCPDCETRGSVHEAAGKRSGCLYQRCECGADQRNGAWVQTRLWYETEWLDGLKPEMPANVYPEEKYLERFGVTQEAPEPVVSEPEPKVEEVEQVEVADLEADAAAEQDTEAKPRKTGLFWLLGVAVGAVVLIAGGS